MYCIVRIAEWQPDVGGMSRACYGCTRVIYSYNSNGIFPWLKFQSWSECIFTFHFSFISFYLWHSFIPIIHGLAFAMDIKPGPGIGRVSSSLSPSVSSSLGRSGLSYTGAAAKAKQLKPFATEDIRVLLLESINETGRDILSKQGYQVEAVKISLSDDELIEKIRWGHTHAWEFRNGN